MDITRILNYHIVKQHHKIDIFLVTEVFLVSEVTEVTEVSEET